MDDKSVNYLAVARLPAAGSEAVLLAERVHRRGGGYEYRDHVIQVWSLLRLYFAFFKYCASLPHTASRC